MEGPEPSTHAFLEYVALTRLSYILPSKAMTLSHHNVYTLHILLFENGEIGPSSKEQS